MLSLPNTGEDSDSSDGGNSPPKQQRVMKFEESKITEHPEDESEGDDEDEIRAENERLKAYLKQLQEQKEQDDDAAKEVEALNREAARFGDMGEDSSDIEVNEKFN